MHVEVAPKLMSFDYTLQKDAQIGYANSLSINKQSWSSAVFFRDHKLNFSLGRSFLVSNNLVALQFVM